MSRSLRMFAAVVVFPCLAAAALAGAPTRKPSQGPVSSITHKMTGVAVDLGKTQTGQPVQAKEKDDRPRPRRADRPTGERVPGLQERHEEEQPESAGWPTR